MQFILEGRMEEEMYICRNQMTWVRHFLLQFAINNIQGEVQLDAQWSPPALGVGPNSEVYVVWYNADYSEPEKYPYGQVTMRFARSLDGGNTFQPAVNPAPNDPKGEQSYPYMTVSDDNRIYISYLNLDYAKVEDNAGTPTVLRIVTSSDGGKTFAPSQLQIKAHVSVVPQSRLLDLMVNFIHHPALYIRTYPRLLIMKQKQHIKIMKNKLQLFGILLSNTHLIMDRRRHFRNQAE